MDKELHGIAGRLVAHQRTDERALMRLAAHLALPRAQALSVGAMLAEDRERTLEQAVTRAWQASSDKSLWRLHTGDVVHALLVTLKFTADDSARLANLWAGRIQAPATISQHVAHLHVLLAEFGKQSRVGRPTRLVGDRFTPPVKIHGPPKDS